MTDHIKAALFSAIDEVFQPQNSRTQAELIQQPDFSFRDLSDSSIKFVEFCMHVEESLDVEIEFSDLMDNPTFSGFSKWLHAKIGQG
ncbi:MAG: acyl carrier protein [Rhodobacteraceae bacterium]|nr:acyl carrier protein [Paracoccaceae bacterium]